MSYGAIAVKKGMSHIYSDFGEHIPVTVLQMFDSEVVGKKEEDNDGYNAIIIGQGNAKPQRVKKPQREEFAKKNIEPKKKVKEFRVVKDSQLDIGQKILPSSFIEGQFVDVTSVSKGKGFSGAMKRHNFGGLEATHGISISHRSHGSTGQCQDPGRVFKGKKMAGQYGNKKTTVQNIEVIKVDDDKGIVLLKGAVPGHKGSYVILKDAVKKAIPVAAEGE